jgi:2-chlorobenzoate 1,2-dioxygenase
MLDTPRNAALPSPPPVHSAAGPAREDAAATAAWLRAMVRPDHVHRDVYTNPAIFDLEMQRLFGCAWIMVGHTSQLRTPEDFFTARIGTQSVIVTRGADGEPAAFYNRCTHRGAKICVMERGSAKRLVCPYHGWAFDHSGQLITIPYETGYAAPLDRTAYSLEPVARVSVYRGFIFASLAASGPSLLEFLGHMRSTIDDFVDRSPTGEVELVGLPLRHHFRANWKTTFENLNDTLHPGFAHAASVVAAKAVEAQVGEGALVASLAMMRANGKPINFFENLPMVTERYGHSYIGGHMGANYSGSTQSAYFQALAGLHGEEKARRILAVDRHLTLIYPSSTWHARYQTVRLVLPLAVDRTEVAGYVFRLVGAPDETFRNSIEYCNGANSAASHVISDDLEIYERVQTGNATGAVEWIPMARGIHQRAVDDAQVTRSPATSEEYIRNQFAAWALLMCGDA